MLFRLIVFRLLPFVLLRFCKDRRQLKLAVGFILAAYFLCFLIAAWGIFSQKQWLGIIYLPLSMLPHYICYAFGIWMLLRCIFSAWSERVWKRIYCLTLLCIVLGILLENYINPYILQIFFKIFK